MAEFGERLKSLRKEKGMKQIELADDMGVCLDAVSCWESENRICLYYKN